MVNQQAVQKGLPAAPVMCDFGAAYCYDAASSGRFWETMEVRAFGLFMKDMVGRTVSSSSVGVEDSSKLQKQQLEALVSICLAENAVDRPCFGEAIDALLAAMRASKTPVPE